MDSIVLPLAVYERIRCHAQAQAPWEAIGIIGGSPEGIAVAVAELPNLAEPGEFFADPYAQYQAERRFAREGLEVIAIYHSHPGGGPVLSALDRIFAEKWRCAQLIIVPDRDADDPDHLRAYRVRGSAVIEIPIQYESHD